MTKRAKRDMSAIHEDGQNMILKYMNMLILLFDIASAEPFSEKLTKVKSEIEPRRILKIKFKLVKNNSDIILLTYQLGESRYTCRFSTKSKYAHVADFYLAERERALIKKYWGVI